MIAKAERSKVLVIDDERGPRESLRVLLNREYEVLLAEKMQASPMRKTADGFIAKAGELRVQAEQAAGKKKFEDAIRLLEESTKEFIRAIRSAGVYIPG